jgi:hypothetical protein
MINKTEEIEESQIGEAQGADDCASPYDLDDLSHNISDIDILVVNFCKKPTKGKKTRDRLLGSLLGMLDEAIEQLVFYKKDLIENKCIEPFEVSSEPNEKDAEDFWKFINMFFDKIKNDELFQSLKDKVARFRTLLAEVENAMRHCDPIVFEKYFFRVKPGDVEEGVVQEFHRKIYENLPITSEKLMVMQSQAVIDAIGKGIFDHAGKASWDEVKKVSPDLATDYVPCDFVVTDEFKKKYALFRRYTYKRGKMLILNYEKYGKYIVDHKYQFKEKQFKAIYELDVMLREIRMEMERLNPELASTPAEQTADNQPVAGEEMFHFVHPSLDDEEGWKIHNEVKRLVRRQSIQEICLYLKGMAKDKKILLPQMPSVAYAELVRMGMPQGEGFSEKHFRNYYMK